MNEIIEIKGGAGAFEAALVAVVLDRIASEARAAQTPQQGNGLPAWIRALDPDVETVPDRGWVNSGQ